MSLEELMAEMRWVVQLLGSTPRGNATWKALAYGTWTSGHGDTLREACERTLATRQAQAPRTRRVLL